MKPYVVAGMACVLGAVAVTFCAIGMYLQSAKNATAVPAVISALKDENRHDTARQLGRAAAADPVLNESLNEALREREAVAAPGKPAPVRDEKSEQEKALQARHDKLLNDALYSIAKGDIEDAKLTYDLAKSFGVNDPQSLLMEKKFEDALKAVEARKNQAAAGAQAQPRKKAAAGDVNPFD